MVFNTEPISKKKWAKLNFSQEKVKGFDLEKNQNSKVLLVGAGAIGSNVGLALVRKGIGVLEIFDDDDVELRNLTRQLFTKNDVGKNKAVCLANTLSTQGFFNTSIAGYPYRFQEILEIGAIEDYDAIICGVDNNPTRVSVAKYCLGKKIPLIMSGVSRDGIQMYVAVQETEKACFGCIMPYAINDRRYPCDLPGIIDVIQVVSGFAVFALDTILMQRYREWNIKSIFLDGSVPDSTLLIPKKANCELCNEKIFK